jgi:hypothetical protein
MNPSAANAIPQWIDFGGSTPEMAVKIDFNSIKRDGERVGFTFSVMEDGKGYAVMTWVACDSWQFQNVGDETGWTRIAADTNMNAIAVFVCTKSKDSSIASINRKNPALTAPVPKGVSWKCTFLPSSGSGRVINDTCKIDPQGNSMTLFWSDKVFTQMRFSGSKVSITSAGGSPYTGRVVAKSSIGGAIEYENGTIKWCWGC